MRLQPALHCCHDALLIDALPLWKPQQLGDGSKAAGDLLQAFRADPEDGTVIQRVAIGIFKGELSFANPPESRDGTGGNSLFGGEYLMEGRKLLLAAGKQIIAGVRYEPQQHWAGETGIEKLAGF